MQTCLKYPRNTENIPHCNETETIKSSPHLGGRKDAWGFSLALVSFRGVSRCGPSSCIGHGFAAVGNQIGRPGTESRATRRPAVGRKGQESQNIAMTSKVWAKGEAAVPTFLSVRLLRCFTRSLVDLSMHLERLCDHSLRRIQGKMPRGCKIAD